MVVMKKILLTEEEWAKKTLERGGEKNITDEYIDTYLKVLKSDPQLADMLAEWIKRPYYTLNFFERHWTNLRYRFRRDKSDELYKKVPLATESSDT